MCVRFNRANGYLLLCSICEARHATLMIAEGTCKEGMLEQSLQYLMFSVILATSQHDDTSQVHLDSLPCAAVKTGFPPIVCHLPLQHTSSHPNHLHH